MADLSVPIISVITPTFRREEDLERCVLSCLNQQVTARIEHWVVNDYHAPLAHRDWMDDPRVHLLQNNGAERAFARNAGAAASKGDWLYFLDDDDHALPGAFAHMLEAAQETQAAHIYGGYQIVSGATGDSAVYAPQLRGDILPMLIAGEGIPPQATWIRRDAFFAVGGFDPLCVPAEDADLVRRISLFGPIAGTTSIVASVRVDHAQTTTTDYGRHHGIWLRGAEKALSMPQTLSRLLKRTIDEPYWRGRCARVYYGSAWRNARAGQWGLAWGRKLGALRLSSVRAGGEAQWRNGFLRRPGAELRQQEDLLQFYH